MSWRIHRWACPLLAAVSAVVPICVAAPAAAAVGALGPGSRVEVYSDVDDSTEQCTAGFVVRNVNRVPLLFTAGHCNVGERVMMRSADTGRQVQVGEIVVSQYDGNAGEDTDIAVMRPTGTVPLVSTVDGLPVTGVLSTPFNGLTLCMRGATTGRSCGPVTEFSDTKVKFAARVDNGDSGGPVWAMTKDGSALAVGIVIRQASEGLPIAELVAPWMRRYNLDVKPA